MELFDTHCHMHELVRRLTPVYDKWREDGVERTADGVIAAANEAAVKYMLCVGTSLADSELAVEFVKDRENVWATIGIHPHEAQHHIQTAQTDRPAKPPASSAPRAALGSVRGDVRERMNELAKNKKVVAVGECGLDYFYTHSPKEAQVELLKFQIELALEHDLPLSFHVREAFDDFWPIFDSYGGKIRGVLHSFTDSEANLAKAVERGLYIGVNGIATFAKQPEKAVTYRTIPQRLLLLETDAPFLTPVPYRGKVCESKHVRVTAEFLSKLRDEDLARLGAATTQNARTLFKV
ncbi:MAG: TatD family hydrolase [Candidatus Saccharimonadales bacterium]